MRFGGITTDRIQEPEETVREEDGLLSVDTAEQMLKWHAEAVGRCVELTPSNDVFVVRSVRAFFVVLNRLTARNTRSLL